MLASPKSSASKSNWPRHIILVAMILTGAFMVWSLFTPVAEVGDKRSLLELMSGHAPPPLSPEVQAMHETGEYVLSLETGQSQEDDSYLCVSVPVAKGVSSVYEYIPDVDKNIVHHMVLFGCLGVSEEAENGVYMCKAHFGVCNLGYPDIMYAWANGAGPLTLGSGKPGSTAGAGYFIGDRVDINYIVLQVHTLKARQKSTAKLTVRTSRTLPDDQMSVMLFGNMDFDLQPKKPSVDVPVTCCVRGSGRVEILGYRVHAHKYGRNVSLAVDGERILEGNTKLPQVFATPENHLSIPFGKTWNVNCNYNMAKSDKTVSSGTSSRDEMCNMYFMVKSNVPRGGLCWSGKDEMAGNYPQLSFYSYRRVFNLGKNRARKVDEIKPDGMGQVAGVHLGYMGDPTKLLIFHRADREMDESDFTTTIDTDVFIVWDTVVQRIEKTFGKGMYKMPHGLTIDMNSNAIWTTDVDSQVAMKLDATTGKELLRLGTWGERGSGNNEMCRPTEVAVSSSGRLFVSDGYCNKRVLAFEADGTFAHKHEISDAMVPHGVVVDDCAGVFFVADRESARVLMMDMDSGSLVAEIELAAHGLPYAIATDEFGTVFALTWRRDNGGKVSLIQLTEQNDVGKLGDPIPVVGVKYVVELPGIKVPHDVAVSYSFRESCFYVYVSETGPGPNGKITVFKV